MLRLPHLLFFWLWSLLPGRSSVCRIAIANDNAKKVVAFCVLREDDFRFSFMKRSDLQFGPVWCDSQMRGKGLARIVCSVAVQSLGRKPGTLWWVCQADNDSSKAMARRMGFTLVGALVRKRSRMLPFLHVYNSVKST